AKRRQRRRRQRPQPNFRRDEIYPPNDDDKSDGSAKDDTAGRSSAGGLDSHRSGQSFFAHGKFVDAVQARFKSNPGTSWHANRALWRHYDFGMDNILLPVALAG